ncbi:MAG: DUF2235 domain-containing protein [Hydrogenophaga sp.]|jgi:hypothetical protein|nr:DUF2235 domain-containing protein [Hydrogenophaga sp.]
MEGTGNHMGKDAQENWTNVALLGQGLREAQRNGADHIGVGYVVGPGTQDNAVIRTNDLATGASFTARVEEGYKQFIDQSAQWLRENPNADISLMAVGFSRGAEQAAALTRLVHERGIHDPDGALYTRNSAGEITHVHYTRPPLVPPGQVAQSVLLFDPVGTGEPERHDRRLASSVLGGMQISARDEKRDPFPSTNVIPPGLSEDGRFLNTEVAGAHSNIGGSYAQNGLSNRSFNLAADYINATAGGEPLLARRHAQRDPTLDVVHRSENHRWCYATRDSEANHGFRIRKELINQEVCGASTECFSRDPMDRALAARVPLGRVAAPAEQQVQTTGDINDLFIRLSDAAMAGDRAGMRAVVQQYRESADGQAWLQTGRAEAAAQREAQAQQLVVPDTTPALYR